jgi:hypothetical protein
MDDDSRDEDDDSRDEDDNSRDEAETARQEFEELLDVLNGVLNDMRITIRRIGALKRALDEAGSECSLEQCVKDLETILADVKTMDSN